MSKTRRAPCTICLSLNTMWMDEILHHLRNPGMLNSHGFSWFLMVSTWFHRGAKWISSIHSLVARQSPAKLCPSQNRMNNYQVLTGLLSFILGGPFSAQSRPLVAETTTKHTQKSPKGEEPDGSDREPSNSWVFFWSLGNLRLSIGSFGIPGQGAKV